MDYDYSGGTGKSANPTWTFTYSITNANPDLDIELYIYNGAEGETWDDDTEFSTPPGNPTLSGVVHVSGNTSQVNIPNLQEGDFVVVKVSCPSCKQSSKYYASSRAGSSKSSGKIILTF